MPYNSYYLVLFLAFLCYCVLLMPRSLVLFSVALAEENLVVLSCSLCSMSGICHQGTAASHFQVWSEIFSWFSLLQKYSRPLERLHFVQVAFRWAKYFARPAGTVFLWENTQLFLCFKCFFNILGLVYRERLYRVMVGWQFKVAILKWIKLIQNKTFLFWHKLIMNN